MSLAIQSESKQVKRTHTTILEFGLALETVAVQKPAGLEHHALEHSWLVRLAHWLNAIVLTIMIASGLEIFAAFPSFGSKVPQVDVVSVPESVRLGGWLGGGLQWHLTFMWLFIAIGVAYLIYQAISGHWRQTFFLPRDFAELWPVVRHYFLFGPKPKQTEPYNALQKLAYTSTIFFGAVAVFTGWLLYKPVQLSSLVQFCGGFGLVRLWHFLAMCGFLAFIPGHLLMVALHGWNNFRSMLTGWNCKPVYLPVQQTHETPAPIAAPGRINTDTWSGHST
jgi:Ni/Fe-hydrogenase b-type cytochrome subunit